MGANARNAGAPGGGDRPVRAGAPLRAGWAPQPTRRDAQCAAATALSCGPALLCAMEQLFVVCAWLNCCFTGMQAVVSGRPHRPRSSARRRPAAAAREPRRQVASSAALNSAIARADRSCPHAAPDPPVRAASRIPRPTAHAAAAVAPHATLELEPAGAGTGPAVGCKRPPRCPLPAAAAGRDASGTSCCIGAGQHQAAALARRGEASGGAATDCGLSVEAPRSLPHASKRLRIGECLCDGCWATCQALGAGQGGWQSESSFVTAPSLAQSCRLIGPAPAPIACGHGRRTKPRNAPCITHRTCGTWGSAGSRQEASTRAPRSGRGAHQTTCSRPWRAAIEHASGPGSAGVLSSMFSGQQGEPNGPVGPSW